MEIKGSAGLDSYVDNGYFLARFSSVEDYEYAKYGGPWLIFNHYLCSLLVWVPILCLPIEYYDLNFFMRL